MGVAGEGSILPDPTSVRLIFQIELEHIAFPRNRAELSQAPFGTWDGSQCCSERASRPPAHTVVLCAQMILEVLF